MRPVVSVQQQQRRADGAQKVARDRKYETRVEQRVPERVDVLAAERSAFVNQRLPPWLPGLGSKCALIGLVAPDGLQRHGCDNALRGQLDQLEDERRADTAAGEQHFVYAQLVKDRQLIARVHAPRIDCIEWSTRATCVALVHRDNPKLVSERLDWIEWHTVPEVNRRVQCAGRQEEQRGPASIFLVVDGRSVTIDRWHSIRSYVSVY